MADMLGKLETKTGLIEKIIGKLKRLPPEVLKIVFELTVRLIGKDNETWRTQLKKFIRQDACWSMRFLRLIKDEDINVVLDSFEDLPEEQEIFSSVGQGLRKFRLKKKRKSTGKVFPEIYELVKRATYPQMLGDLFNQYPFNQYPKEEEIKEFIEKNYNNLHQRCLEWDDVKLFCWKYRFYLSENLTYFLMENDNNEFFVVRVSMRNECLIIEAYWLKSWVEWTASSYDRLVVSRLDKAA